MQLNGFHHLTAVTSHARENVNFYTTVLGMRLVKKTVNQDDVSAYHLYYADAHGSPGTDVTFFDWASIGPQQPGTGAIDLMALRVDSRAAIDYWLARFDAHQVRHGAPFLWHGDRMAVHFADPEGQRLLLISDEGVPGGVAWDKSPVPAEYAIKGIFGAGITVRNREQMTLLYRDVLGFDLLSEGVDPNNPLHYQYLFAAGDVVGGALMVQVAPDLPPSRLGSGGVHHMAFRVPDQAAQEFWIERLQRVGLQPTQSIDRFYFRSVYARVPGNVLIEIATDGPGFATDEPLETMGETLALPPSSNPSVPKSKPAYDQYNRYPYRGDYAMAATPTYSVVIPVYNSAKIVSLVIARTVAFFEKQGWSYEIILVNDGSRDNSWQVIAAQAAQFPHVISINLLRNYGQHNAVFCGIGKSRGEYVITIDDDLQNPPEEIIHLVNQLQAGNHDVVFGRFRQKQHSLGRRVGSGLIRMINNHVFYCPADIVPSNFRLIHRSVIDRMMGYTTAYPYTTGLALMFAQSIGNVWVEHRERHEGKSNYNLVKIMSLVLRILFNYSIWPMRLVTGTGFVISFLSFSIGIVLVFRKLLDNIQIEGWTGIMVMLAILNGLIILMLGMLGEYTVRILQQMNSKETYHIKDIVSHDA